MHSNEVDKGDRTDDELIEHGNERRKCNSKRIHLHIYTCFSSSSSTFLRAHSLERKDKYTRGWAFKVYGWVKKFRKRKLQIE